MSKSENKYFSWFMFNTWFSSLDIRGRMSQEVYKLKLMRVFRECWSQITSISGQTIDWFDKCLDFLIVIFTKRTIKYNHLIISNQTLKAITYHQTK